MDSLFSTLYSELHRLAQQLVRRGTAASLGVTTLLHEAYLDMSTRPETCFPDQARFMGYAARVMRGLVVDDARNRFAMKRGGEFHITSLDDDAPISSAGPREISLIGDALDQLEKVEPELAEVVDLKFFAGCSFVEIAALRNLSERTVQRKWDKARIYLRHAIAADSSL